MLDIITTYFDYLHKLVRIGKTIDELNRLSDKELKDIGVHRCEIPYIAYEANTK